MYKHLHKNAINLLAFGLFITLHSQAEAHYVIVGGKLYYHSLQCEKLLKGVQNPDANPAAVVCNVTGQEIEILCENPTNLNVLPGQAGIQTFTETNQVGQEDVTGKGKATVEVIIETDAQLLKPEYCVNPNWNPVAALVRRAMVDLKTYECLNADCSELGDLASTLVLECNLPSFFNFANMPQQGDAYACNELSRNHNK